jgi:hypothetical protein
MTTTDFKTGETFRFEQTNLNIIEIQHPYVFISQLADGYATPYFNTGFIYRDEYNREQLKVSYMLDREYNWNRDKVYASFQKAVADYNKKLKAEAESEAREQLQQRKHAYNITTQSEAEAIQSNLKRELTETLHKIGTTEDMLKDAKVKKLLAELGLVNVFLSSGVYMKF